MDCMDESDAMAGSDCRDWVGGVLLEGETG